MYSYVSRTNSLSRTGPHNLDMFGKISNFDPNMIYRRLSRKKALGTTTWLANHPDFKNWLVGDKTSQRRLWLSGKGRISLSLIESRKC